MYVPAHFAADVDSLHGLLSSRGAANLVTSTAHGMLATLLPFVYDPSVGEHGALLGHLARNNPQWSEPALGESLVIVQGPDAYISPAWYASKAEHGRVVWTMRPNASSPASFGRSSASNFSSPGWRGSSS